jgi:anaerobic magnesium-protoporphyrin IX monomethyl ester cyclase
MMNKKATVDEGIEAVQHFRKAGIQTAAFFIVGYPAETISSIEATCKLALTLPLDEISFNVPYPLPGSRLFERVSGIDENKDWNKENEVTFVYSSEFDETWLRQRIGQTMQAFAQRTRKLYADGRGSARIKRNFHIASFPNVRFAVGYTPFSVHLRSSASA